MGSNGWIEWGFIILVAVCSGAVGYVAGLQKRSKP